MFNLELTSGRWLQRVAFTWKFVFHDLVAVLFITLQRDTFKEIFVAYDSVIL